ncbi:MAG: hydroxyisourate hydrolase [Pseudomonadales bacterium]|jgi:5-hydroxyisourate hydrolase
MTAPITTHILDTSKGQPASGVRVELIKGELTIATGITNKDGRVAEWDREYQLESCTYTLNFSVAGYFAEHDEPSFYDDIQIRFKVVSTTDHYHVPLLLNPFGYSTYRGS